MICFECDAPAVHQHHVVPASLGGRRTVPLCGQCHGLIHDHGGLLTTSTLTAAAMARKRAAQEYTGGHAPYGWRREDGRLIVIPEEHETIAMAHRLWHEGWSLRAIGQRLTEAGRLPRVATAWSAETVRALLRRSR